jgi:hypothetical protein
MLSFFPASKGGLQSVAAGVYRYFMCYSSKLCIRIQVLRLLVWFVQLYILVVACNVTL